MEELRKPSEYLSMVCLFLGRNLNPQDVQQALQPHDGDGSFQITLSRD
jgi:hypothetical protein